MNELPRKGDRVRVVYEGEVVGSSELLGDVRVRCDTGHTILTGRSAKAIEVLERAPGFKPGTVAVSSLRPSTPAIRGEDGWRGPSDADWLHLDDRIVGSNKHFTVVYEPPA